MKKFGLICVVLTLCSLMLIACSDKHHSPPANPASPSHVSTGQPPQPQIQGSGQGSVGSLPHSNPNLVEVGGVRLNFIDLPAVTEEEVQRLQQALDARGNEEQTALVAMPAFRAAEAKTSIGLYHAVMGVYPDLAQVNDLSEQERAEILREWAANPDRPLTYTTTAEDIRFAEELSRRTGRRFTVMTNSQNEYSIRGRVLDANHRPTGPITTSIYHFGEEDSEVRNHAFIWINPLTLNHSHGVHEIPEAPNALYKNSFGLIHPIGNVWSRSIEGVARGGAFNGGPWSTGSSFSDGGLENYRNDDVGTRLAESRHE